MGLFRFIVNMIKLTIFVTITMIATILFIWITSTILKIILSIFFPEHSDIIALALAILLLIIALTIINRQL
jgi:hypothetical protein